MRSCGLGDVAVKVLLRDAEATEARDIGRLKRLCVSGNDVGECTCKACILMRVDVASASYDLTAD